MKSVLSLRSVENAGSALNQQASKVDFVPEAEFSDMQYIDTWEVATNTNMNIIQGN